MGKGTTRIVRERGTGGGRVYRILIRQFIVTSVMFSGKISGVRLEEKCTLQKNKQKRDFFSSSTGELLYRCSYIIMGKMPATSLRSIVYSGGR